MFKVLTNRDTLEVKAFNVARIGEIIPMTDEDGTIWSLIIINGYEFKAVESMQQILEQHYI